MNGLMRLPRLEMSISRAAANSLGIILAATRAFMAIAVDGAYLGNSGWLCVIIGFALSLPAAIACDAYVKRGETANENVFRRVSAALIAVVAVYETAALARMLTNTTSYCELSTVSAGWLTVVMLVLIYYILTKNGAGVGNAARLWLFAAPVLFLIVLIAQYRVMVFSWLTPVFGPGVESILTGGVRVAGYLAFTSVIHALSKDAPVKRAPCLKTLAVASAAALVLVLARAALTPPMPDAELDRVYQLDLLLSNGRVAISLQFPLILLWYLGLLVTFGGYAFAAAAALQLTVPGLDGRLCALAAIGASAALVFLRLAEGGGAAIASDWELIVIFAALSALMLPRAAKGAAK